VYVIEFDMNVTADDDVVIHHDMAVNSEICAPGPGSPVKAGPIRLLTLRQIREFDCGSRVPARHPRQTPAPGARMAALHKLLGVIRNSGVTLLARRRRLRPVLQTL
jgi:glycerophosphoryl diester phosphodiesterase